MHALPEKTLASIGRMTVAATDLEHLLAWIAADQIGGDPIAVFARPGAAMVAASESVRLASQSVRAELVTAVEAAGAQLAIGHSALRRLWHDETPADPAVFDEIAGQLVRCRSWLRNLVEEYLGVAVG